MPEPNNPKILLFTLLYIGLFMFIGVSCSLFQSQEDGPVTDGNIPLIQDEEDTGFSETGFTSEETPDSLSITLSDGDAEPEVVDRISYVSGEPLSDEEIQVILSRVQDRRN